MGLQPFGFMDSVCPPGHSGDPQEVVLTTDDWDLRDAHQHSLQARNPGPIKPDVKPSRPECLSNSQKPAIQVSKG